YLSGIEEIEILFHILGVDVTLKKEDGDQIQSGDIIVELRGKTKDILLGERVGLNLMSHMSAITSTTRKFVNIIEKSGKIVKIACTRKTLPGLRLFEKKAVDFGKGDTHRFNLDDMVLLKSTHLKFYNGNVAELLKNVKSNVSFTKKIEIEVEKVGDVLIAVQNGADIIMLDNMNPNRVQDAINLLKKHNLRENVTIEVSGNITQDNIIDFLINEKNIEKIIICGYSYGAAIGCSVVNFSEKIIGYCAISFPWDFMGSKYKELSQTKKPKLFIQGNRDTIALYENFENHYNFYFEPKKYKIINGADHFYSGFEEKIAQEVSEFYNSITI
ncbi:unnamed protein product, partial [marine sediment metagenome]